MPMKHFTTEDVQPSKRTLDLIRTIAYTYRVMNLQRMDGYSPTLFYDFGHYISKKCSDPELLDAFSRQLDKTIIYKGNTEYYYSALAGPVRIDHFSGMNTSAPSTNRLAQGYEETEWGKRILK